MLVLYAMSLTLYVFPFSPKKKKIYIYIYIFMPFPNYITTKHYFIYFTILFYKIFNINDFILTFYLIK